jgi:hypothetical protein
MGSVMNIQPDFNSLEGHAVEMMVCSTVRRNGLCEFIESVNYL